jgi:acyl dehydratase
MPEVGETRSYERTFTEADVRRFVEVSDDRGSHHVETDESDRLLVHGLLTATLPTKIGGDLDVLAHRMEFEFRRPVYTGERLRCTVTFTTVEPQPDRDRTRLETDLCVVRTADGETVLSGGFEGYVHDETEARGGPSE